jgi:hypothetical protein
LSVLLHAPLNLLDLVAVQEFAYGPKRTCQSLSAMSAFGGKADIEI